MVDIAARYGGKGVLQAPDMEATHQGWYCNNKEQPCPVSKLQYVCTAYLTDGVSFTWYLAAD